MHSKNPLTVSSERIDFGFENFSTIQRTQKNFFRFSTYATGRKPNAQEKIVAMFSMLSYFAFKDAGNFS